MTVTVKCQYTEIEFQAKTARTKNHPTIAFWLQEANTEGWYTEALAAIKAGNEAVFETIAEYKELLKETQTASKAQQAVDHTKWVLEYRQRKADRQARDEAQVRGEYNRIDRENILSDIEENNSRPSYRPTYESDGNKG